MGPLAACQEGVPAFDTVEKAAGGCECELALFLQEVGGRIARAPLCIGRAQDSLVLALLLLLRAACALAGAGM